MLVYLTQALCWDFVKYVGDVKIENPKYTQLTDDNFVVYVKCQNYKILTCQTNDGSIYAASQQEQVLNSNTSNSNNCWTNTIKIIDTTDWDGYYPLPSCPYIITKETDDYRLHYGGPNTNETSVVITPTLNKYLYNTSMVEKTYEITINNGSTRYLIQPENKSDIKCGIDYDDMISLNPPPYNCSLADFTPKEEQEEQQEETSDDKSTKRTNHYENFFFATSIIAWVALVLVIATIILKQFQHKPVKNIFPTKPIGRV